MKLQDLYPLLEESVAVYVFIDEDRYSDAIASYDGRNSIPNEYNECDIAHIFPASYKSLDVFITNDSFIKAEKYKKANERDRWLFGTDYDKVSYMNGKRYFELTSESLREAIRLGYIDENKRDADVPTVYEFLAFVTETSCPDGWSFEGVATAPDRNGDVSMHITAIYASDADFTRDDLCLFADAFRHAVEFELTPYNARAWWGYY